MELLALKAMLADRGKLLTGLMGVGFAVVLVNLQGGLYLGLMHKASLIVDCGQADLWVGHRHMESVDLPAAIPERWATRLRGVAGVERADPYIITYSEFAMPDGRHERVVLVGTDAAGLLGNAWSMAAGNSQAVRQPDGILIDACELDKLGRPQVGDLCELNGRRARIAGLTDGIVSFTTCPYVFTTLEQARTKYSIIGIPPGYCSYILVKAKPGTDLPDLIARIQKRVPELDIRTKSDYAQRSRKYWQVRTGIGLSFGLAAVLGLLVGLVIVAQTLYASVNERLTEFATLRALGTGDGPIARFLLAQALGHAGLGSGFGIVLSQLIGRVLSTPRAPVLLSVSVMAGSVVLVTVVCMVAAWLPYRCIRGLDPASVLRK